MITLVLGGTRSGKSAVAERLAAMAAGVGPDPSTGARAGDGDGGAGVVTYVATAPPAVDADFAARIADHRARRPGSWVTLECVYPAALCDHLRHTEGVILLDSLGTWVATHDGRMIDSSPLLDALTSRDGDTIVVSEEVGLAVHPPTEVGRRYVDAVGTLNQQVAAVSDRALFVVAGQILTLSPLEHVVSLPPTLDA